MRLFENCDNLNNYVNISKSLKNSTFYHLYHPYRCFKLQTISVGTLTIFLLFSFVLLSQTIVSSFIYATSNNSEGITSSPSQTPLNNDNDDTDISDKSSDQDLSNGEDNNKEDPSADSDLQTLNGNLLEEKPIDEALLQPPLIGTGPANTEAYTNEGYLTIEILASDYTDEMKQTIDSVSICVQTRILAEDNKFGYSVPANPNCSIGVDKEVTFNVHPGQVSLSITNVGAKFKIYDEECPKTIEPGESKSCIISFVCNPVLMDLEDRPRDIDIMKQ